MLTGLIMGVKCTLPVAPLPSHAAVCWHHMPTPYWNSWNNEKAGKLEQQLFKQSVSPKDSIFQHSSTFISLQQHRITLQQHSLLLISAQLGSGSSTWSSASFPYSQHSKWLSNSNTWAWSCTSLSLYFLLELPAQYSSRGFQLQTASP